MTSHMKALALAALLSLGAGASSAADKAMECCCKDKDGKMSCCDEMKKSEGNGAPTQQQPTPEHKH